MKGHMLLSWNLTGRSGPVVVGDHAPFCLGHPPVAASSPSRSPMKILMLPRYRSRAGQPPLPDVTRTYAPQLESEGLHMRELLNAW